jgi:Fe-S oxidoreductase
LMTAYFGMNVSAAGMGAKSLRYLPVSLAISSFVPEGVSPNTFFMLQRVFWWAHALVFLFFLDFIPYSKHLHILASLPNCFFRSLSFVTSMPKMLFQANSSFGVSKVTQFSWKGLMDFLACTECGRCQSVCPANAVGKELNPKEVVHQGKMNLFENGRGILASRPADTLGRVSEATNVGVPMIGNGDASVSPDAVWQCTTCGACMDICPVFIEHAPKLIEMRRHLVMEKVDFPSELTSFFENIEQRSNPWGLAPGDRAKWAQNLNIPHFSKTEGHEYLLYTGCLGAYDSRAKKVALSVAEVLQSAGISFGILGAEEMCCGDAMRRLGNEYIFDRMARQNVSLFKKAGVNKIITTCPHCYNTLKNDYRDYGADFEVLHHTEILDEVFNKGLFKSNGKFKNERIVIHDSCYLARYNNMVEEPRSLIKGVAGARPIEMENNGRDGFCCGAGGGRMWLEEEADARVNRERTRQALKENPTIVATCCPFCITMFEDGLKEVEVAGAVRVMDVGELFHEGMVSLTARNTETDQAGQRKVINE